MDEFYSPDNGNDNRPELLTENRELKMQLDETRKELEEVKKSLYTVLLNPGTKADIYSGYTDIQDHTSMQLRDILSMSKNSAYYEDIYTGEEPATTRNFKFVRSLEGHKGSVFDCSFSPKGEYAISASFDEKMILWNTATGARTKLISKHESPIVGVCWRHQGNIASGGLHGSICSWSVSKNTDITCMSSFFMEGLVTSVASAVIGENQYIAASSTRGGVNLFDLRTGKRCRVFKMDSQVVNSIVIDEENGQIVSGDANGVCQLLDINTEKVTDTFKTFSGKNNPVADLALTTIVQDSTRQTLIALSSYKSVISIYQVNPNKTQPFSLKMNFKGFRNVGYPIKCSFSPSNSGNDRDNSSYLLATGSCDNNVLVYDYHEIDTSANTGVLSRFPIHTLEGHSDRVYSTSFHPKKRLLLSASADYSLNLYKY